MTSPKTARARRLCLILLAVLASGCASLAPLPAPAPAAVPSPIGRTFHETIDIAGRLSLRYEQNGLEQTIDGKFTWNQASGLTRITLLTPFGQTMATIDVTPGLSTLTQDGQAPRSAADVDALTATALGWPLPIAGLREWLQGFAVDARGARYVASAAASGDAAFVNTADGWLIKYPTWETDGTAAIRTAATATTGTPTAGARPRRIDLQRLTTQAGNVTLRIVLDEWQPR